jgi:hypothetical protein
MIATIASVAIDHGQAELALQVNPFDYLGRHSKATAYATEAEYNDAVRSHSVSRARGRGDRDNHHFRVSSSEGLAAVARCSFSGDAPAGEA